MNAEDPPGSPGRSLPRDEGSSEQLAGLLRQQDVVAKLAAFALNAPDITAILDRATENVARTLDVDFALIFEGRTDGSLLLRAAFGVDDAEIDLAAEPPSDGSAVGFTLSTGRPSVVSPSALHVTDSTQPLPRSPLVERLAARSGVNVVIPGRSGPYGVLSAWSKTESSKQNHDLSRAPEGFLNTVAAVVASGVAQKNAEEEKARCVRELERSNAELDGFVHIVSHDLQAPLRSVSSFVEILVDHLEDAMDSEAERFASFAQGGVSRMRQLIHDLLLYARVGTRGRDPVEVSARDAAQEAVTALRVELAESDATVTIDALPNVLADPAQLTQLFQNLVGNAIKFRSNHPLEIHISASEEGVGAGEGKDVGDRWRLTVSDNGIGVASEHREKVFGVFERLHTVTAYPGTGIGLAISKKIVERHGGRIWLDATPGGGATVLFTLRKA